jgi:predicted nucleic acid-binding protein
MWSIAMWRRQHATAIRRLANCRESEQAARDVEALLRRFEIVSMAGDAIAIAGARNFRFLRRRGITIRKTIDLLIGTWCIENRASLLHNDSDFHPMTRYLGLKEFIGRER